MRALWENFVSFDSDGSIMRPEVKLNSAAVGVSTISASIGEISATPTAIPGVLTAAEDGDLIAVNLVAGQIYSFDFRGSAGGLQDPYLFLLNPTQTTVLAQDDDGGAGSGSMITYRPTVSGTYYLFATSYDAAVSGAPAADVGAYTINVWSPEADVPGSTNVLASLPTAATIGVGTYYGNLDVINDNDYYKINVVAGQVYTFNYSGGVSGAADRNGEYGENLARLTLYNSAGTSLSTNFNYESGTSYYAATSGTIYLRVAGSTEPALGGTGGYTIDVGAIDPSTRDPLQSLNWDTARNIDTVSVGGQPTAYVYFAPAGQNFGEKADDNIAPLVTFGWTAAQQAAVMSVLSEYTQITGIKYLVTTDVNQAEFRMLTANSQQYGARFYPQDPAYGTQQGIGTFNLLSGGFGSDPASLLPGGYSYAVILHEFGHAHGIAHPHDTGGGSEVMLGVTASTGSLGVYDLNQGVYTVMSYNDGWVTDPDGVRSYSAANRTSGWSETLGAFDIAVLQARYGVHANNDGDTVYTIADVQLDSQYRTIWDTSGVDTIAYNGARDAQIDLLAATLDYSPTGGGVVSFAHGIWGGFTIANGVVVENATGGSGNDVILGNSANNLLTGNGGNDMLSGRSGNDFLNGGAGNDMLDGGAGLDTALYVDALSGVNVNLALVGAQDTLGAGSDTLISIENLVGSGFADILSGDGGDNRLSGLAGNDSLFGQAGSDTLSGGDGNDWLGGGEGNDRLFGGTGNDVLDGGLGTDFLNGGAGNDRLIGGGGIDAFVFTDAGTDTIVGYQAGETIDISAFGVTMANVRILATGIYVDLPGVDDLTILFNTRLFTVANLIIDPAFANSAAHLDAGIYSLSSGASDSYFL